MNELRKKTRIGVIGGNRPKAEFAALAYEVGREIGRRGAILVCGGLGGVMEQAARGAAEAGGLTIGILPGSKTAEANPYIHVAVVTGIGYARNSLVALNADVLIAVDGEYGTLSEIAFGFIHGKKVIGLGTWAIKGVRAAATAAEAVRLALEPVD